MENNKYMPLKQPLQEYFASLANYLRPYLRESYRNIGVGCTVLVTYGNASAVLSVTPHGDPDEEPINIDYNAILNEEKKETEIYLCLIGVDGHPTKTYFRGNKTYTSLDELATELIKLFEQLKLDIINDIQTELQINRPPFYTKH